MYNTTKEVIIRIIRNEDFPCLVDYRFKNLKNQLKRANELGVLIALIVGPDEMEKNRVTVKNMVSEEQNTILIDDLIDEIYRIIDEFEEFKKDQ
ncbi:MAG: His/Gly/Thr/Pro-type tRNA ligase C-terminal domain-containing protein [Promethearchaeota archaeon]